MKLKSGVRIRNISEKTKELLSDNYYENLLTNTGKDVIMNKLINTSGYTAEKIATKIGVGRNNTVASSADTDLADPNSVEKDIANTVYNAYRLTMNVTYSASEANFTWQELGLFRDATLIARVVLPQVNRKTDQVSSIAQWEFSFSEGV